MIVRRIKPSRIVVLSITVAAVMGHKPLVGFTEEVERKWKKLKEKFGLKERMGKQKEKQKTYCKRSSSSSQLEELANQPQPPPAAPNQMQYKRQMSEAKASMAKFQKMDEEIQSTYYNDDVFSKTWVRPKFDKTAPDYGRPKKGSLTEKRGIEAGNHVCKEIIYLCEVIEENGNRNEDGTVTIPFGKLFNIYVWISDKVVGMLLRARRHKMVAFEGEMLFQRQDDHVPITLLYPLEKVRQFYEASNDPARCVSQL